MKKLFLLLAAFGICVSLFGEDGEDFTEEPPEGAEEEFNPESAAGLDEEPGIDFTYRISGINGEQEITITGYTGTETEISIPDFIENIPVTIIGDGVFAGLMITRIELPGSLKGIENRAFANCVKLTAITIPDNVGVIGNFAFYGSGLTALTFPAELVSIGTEAFADCTGLTSLRFPEKLISIGDWAFFQCSGLTDIGLSRSLAVIGPGAFAKCSRLSRIDIPDKVAVIGDWAFYGCAALTGFTVQNNPNFISRDGVLFDQTGGTLISYAPSKQVLTYAVPQGVSRIAPGAFLDCVKLVEVTFPAGGGVTIEDAAFAGCSSLIRVNLPAGKLTIGKRAFADCANLKRLSFPPGNTVINDDAFARCSKLRSVSFSSGSADVGTAFTGCKTLEIVIFGTGNTVIRPNAFAYSPELTTLSIGAGTAVIGSNAFYGCEKLVNITLANKQTTKIGAGAFMRTSGAPVYRDDQRTLLIRQPRSL
jgi:hypothetical protein